MLQRVSRYFSRKITTSAVLGLKHLPKENIFGSYARVQTRFLSISAQITADSTTDTQFESIFNTLKATYSLDSKMHREDFKNMYYAIPEAQREKLNVTNFDFSNLKNKTILFSLLQKPAAVITREKIMEAVQDLGLGVQKATFQQLIFNHLNSFKCATGEEEFFIKLYQAIAQVSTDKDLEEQYTKLKTTSYINSFRRVSFSSESILDCLIEGTMSREGHWFLLNQCLILPEFPFQHACSLDKLVVAKTATGPSETEDSEESTCYPQNN